MSSLAAQSYFGGPKLAKVTATEEPLKLKLVHDQ